MWVKPEGKELQVASLLANKGHDVEFLKPSSEKGDRTPDIRIDGELFEIKRIESLNPTTIHQRVSDGLNQSGNVIIDLSISEDHDFVERIVREMNDERIRKILIVKNGEIN